VEATQDPRYKGLPNVIDMFELERKNSISKTRERTAIYYKTMDFVREAMGAFYIMRPSLRKRIIVDGMFPVIERMMEEDPQLQEAVTEGDNPGGPPPLPLPTNDIGQMIPDDAGLFSDHRPATTMSGQEAQAQHNTGPYRPPIFRTATAPIGSSGATEKMAGVGLHKTSRTASSNNTPYHHLPKNPRLASSQDLGESMPRPDSFSNQHNRRSSSHEDDDGNKRRKTGL
jgi:hypothetical protein